MLINIVLCRLRYSSTVKPSEANISVLETSLKPSWSYDDKLHKGCKCRTGQRISSLLEVVCLGKRDTFLLCLPIFAMRFWAWLVKSWTAPYSSRAHLVTLVLFT